MRTTITHFTVTQTRPMVDTAFPFIQVFTKTNNINVITLQLHAAFADEVAACANKVAA